MPIILNNISKTYGNTEIFKNFSFEFKEGNIYSLTGTVGIGKTTLLNIISSVAQIDSGEITGLNNKKISYLFQDNRLLKNKNVSENLRFVLKDYMNKMDSDKIIEKYLKLFGLFDYRDSKICGLSGGMQRKLAIARALALPNFDILLLDEPFNNIDIKQKNSIMKTIISNIPKNAIVILVTHNVQDIYEFIDKVYILNEHPNNSFEIKNVKIKDGDKYERDCY